MHFSVLVIMEPSCDNIKEQLGSLLEKFDMDAELEFEDMTEDIENEFYESKYIDFETYLKDYGYEYNGDRIGRYVNFDGIYDWYQIGGRFSEILKLKENVKNIESLNDKDLTSLYTNIAYKEDLDLDNIKFDERYYGLIYNDEYYDEYCTNENFTDLITKIVKESPENSIFCTIDMHN